ncbi:3D domain-containing protein [Thermosipho globiformans]|uniref:3D domain-containing protein n=1 Tax=Thermosipho globiformans TaxID=380685 RepID=UPI000F8DDEA5|nr:3D domain-containing protein [Thermosipho globiformans]
MAKYAGVILVLMFFLFSCNYVTYDQYKILEERVYGIENIVNEHETRIASLEKKFDNLSQRVDTQINDLNNKLNEINNVADIEYLKNFTRKIAIELSDLQNQMNKVTSEITSYNLKTVIYRLNYLEGMAERLELSKVNDLLNQALEKYETGYKQILDIENRLYEMNLTIDSLKETVDEIQSISGEGVTQDSIAVNQIIQKFEKIRELEERLNDLSFKVDSISSKENLERELATIKQISSELNFLKQEFKMEDIEDILKLRQGYINYVIRPGDTLYIISKRYNLGKDGVERLITFNAIEDPNRIIPGQVIKIPIDNLNDYVRVPIDIEPRDILSYFGDIKSGRTNLGIDISAEGKEVYPILPGRVTVKGNDVLYVDHGNGVLAIYKGIETGFKENDWVVPEKPIGKVHGIFHFEIWVDGEPKDPFRFFFKYKGKFDVTFYTPWDDGKIVQHPTFRLTRIGKIAKEWQTVAVDSSLIPLGSYVYIPQLKKVFIAEDTGSAVNGRRIDVYVEEVSLARKNSIKKYDVYVLEVGGS